MACVRWLLRYAKIKLRVLIWAFVGGLLLTPSAQAQTNFSELNAEERAAFGAEIRAALLENPALVAGVSSVALPPSSQPISPITQAYAQAVADDLALIRHYSARLFDPAQTRYGDSTAPVPLAVFISPDCPSCAAVLRDLQALVRDTPETPVRITILDITREADMAAALGLTSAPSYVLPNMMIRGQMPNIVLARYIKSLTEKGPAQMAGPSSN